MPEPETTAIEGDAQDWLDTAIASLRQSVEGHAPGHKVSDHDAVLARRSLCVVDAVAWDGRDPTARRRLPRPTAPLRRATRLVRRRRFDIVFYGLCIGVTVAVTLMVVAVSTGQP